MFQCTVFISFMLFAHHLMSLCSDMNNLQMFFLEAFNCDRLWILWWKKLTRECNLFSGNCLDILCWLEGERTNLICNAKSHRAAAAASLLTVSPQQLVWVLCFHSALHILIDWMAAGALLLPQIKRVCGEIMQMMYNASQDYTLYGQLSYSLIHIIYFYPV